jgi:hypothetical protein
LLGEEIFLPKFEGYLSQWQFYLSHNAHENEADYDHRRTTQLLFHKIGKFQAQQLLFSLGEPRPDLFTCKVFPGFCEATGSLKVFSAARL